MTEENKQIAVIEYDGYLVEIDQEKLMTAFMKPNGFSELLERVSRRVSDKISELPDDMSVLKNRKAIRTVGGKIGTLKSALEKTGDAVKAALKSKLEKAQREVDTVSGNKKALSFYLKELREKTTKPAADWEEKERNRKWEILGRITGIKELLNLDVENLSSDYLENSLKQLLETEIDDSFEEFRKDAEEEKEHVVKFLEMSIKLAENREAEEERKQKERDDIIARNAKEKAEKEAADKITREKVRTEAAEKKIDDLHKMGLQGVVEIGKVCDNPSSELIRMKLDMLSRTDFSEKEFGKYLNEAAGIAAGIESNLKAMLEEVLKLEQAEQAEADKKNAEKLAAEAERKRKEDAAKRSADKKHVAEVDGRAIAAMVDRGFDKKIAAKLLYHIKKGDIPGILLTINQLRVTPASRTVELLKKEARIGKWANVDNLRHRITTSSGNAHARHNHGVKVKFKDMACTPMQGIELKGLGLTAKSCYVWRRNSPNLHGSINPGWKVDVLDDNEILNGITGTEISPAYTMNELNRLLPYELIDKEEYLNYIPEDVIKGIRNGTAEAKADAIIFLIKEKIIKPENLNYG